MKSENNFVFGYNPNTNRFKMDSCCGGSNSGHGNGHGHHGSGHSHNEGNHQHEVKYQCPMKCEGDKTYDQPGDCPVCNMKLAPAGEGHRHCH